MSGITQHYQLKSGKKPGIFIKYGNTTGKNKSYASSKLISLKYKNILLSLNI